MNPEDQWCGAEIYIEGLPIRCQRDFGHEGLLHCSTDTLDSSNGENIVKDGAEVTFVWKEKKA